MHETILDLVSKRSQNKNVIGISSGASSIFPTTIVNPSFQMQRRIEYQLVDGQFQDEHGHCEYLISDRGKKRPTATVPILDGLLIPSSLGTHTSLTMTARTVEKNLAIRTIVQISTKRLALDFYWRHIAYMSVTVAKGCYHDRRQPVQERHIEIVTTSVQAPTIATRPGSHWQKTSHKGLVQTRNQLAVVLTHNNPEAEFVACTEYTRALFQGDSCLQCALSEAYQSGYELVIQS
jgi:hypothetical protein